MKNSELATAEADFVTREFRRIRTRIASPGTQTRLIRRGRADVAPKDSLMKLRTASLVLLCAGMGYAIGYVSHQQKLFPYGVFGGANDAETQTESGTPNPRDGKRADALNQLRTLPYVGGVNPAPKKTGVVVHDRDLVYPGYNLYSTAEVPESTLMDMDGKILHTWRCSHRDLWPNQDDVDEEGDWAGAHLFQNGDLLVTYESIGLLKLDRNSKPIWIFPGGCHHDLDVLEDGTIYVLFSQPRRSPSSPGQGFMDDAITKLTADGQHIETISILEAFKNSPYVSVLSGVAIVGDYLHTNAIEVLDGRLESESPAFKAGNILVSAREIDVIAIIDPEARKVVWALSGMWVGQHHPTLLQNGNILLFDNQGHRQGATMFSKVVEFNPFTQQVVWAYEGNAENEFFSDFKGHNQRLPNGNTLIADATNGRIIEVTRDKKIVWEFVNPERAGEKDELISVVSDMQRIELDFPMDWLEQPSASAPPNQ